MLPHLVVPLASLGLIIGLGSFYAFPDDPAPILLAATAGLFVAAAFAMVIISRNLLGHRAWGALPSFFTVTVAAFGLLYGAWDTTLLANRFDAVAPSIARAAETGHVQTRLVELEPYRGGGFVGLADIGQGLSLRLYDRGEELSADLIGCEIRLEGRLIPPRPPAAKYGYDPRAMAFFKGEAGRFSVQRVSRAVCPTRASFGVMIAKWRHDAALRYRAAMSPPASALASALMFGFRGALPEPTKQAYRFSGLAHILAISGLHMALVAGGLFGFMRLCLAALSAPAGMLNSRGLSAGFALLGALAYLFLSGAAYATQRAFIMIACVFLAILLRRPVFSIHTAALAAFLILLLDPSALRSPGFLMSFAAVISLIRFYHWYFHNFNGVVRHHRSLWHIAMAYLIGLSFTSLVAGLSTGLIGLSFFNQVAVYGLLANLLAMPIFVFWVMPALIVSYVFLATPLFPFLARLAEQGLMLISDIALWISHLPGAVRQVGLPPDSYLIAVAVFFIGLAGNWWHGRRIWLLPLLVVAVIAEGRPYLPDLYILGRGREVAYRDTQGGLRLAAPVQDEFVVSQWFTLEGQAISSGPTDACGARYCRLAVRDGWRLDIAYSARALDVACRFADIVISPVVRQSACAAQYLYTGQYAPDAVHAVYLDGPQQLRVVDTRNSGRRLWHISGNKRSSR